MNELRIGDIITDALEREDLQVRTRDYNVQTHERTLNVCYTRSSVAAPCFEIRIKDVTHLLPKPARSDTIDT